MNDYLGTSEADTFYGGAGRDRAFGFHGDDLFYGNDGRDILIGAAGNDTLYGGSGADALRGGSGDDFIDAGTGADVVNGGAGSDTLYGGAGADKFVFTNVEAVPIVYDEIKDFNAQEGDTIDVRVFGLPHLAYDDVDDVTEITFDGSNEHIVVNGLVNLLDLVT